MSRTSKYHNRKVIIDGIVFDSLKEASRYQELRLMERGGVIKDLRRQVPFELIPKQRIRGLVHQPVRYIADFVYLDENGYQVVEDVKGVRTQAYIIKSRLLLWLYGIEVKET